MTCRTVVARFALLALLLPAPVRADLIIPSDFEFLSGSAFKHCELFGFYDVSHPAIHTQVTACVEGLAYYGRNTSSGLYGVTYDFWTTYLGTPPEGAFVNAGMRGFQYDHITEMGQHTTVTIGSLSAFTNIYLTHGVFYSPLLYADSRIVQTLALYLGKETLPFPQSLDQRFGPVAVTTIPEPPTIVLLGAGLMVAAGARHLQRRRTRAA